MYSVTDNEDGHPPASYVCAPLDEGDSWPDWGFKSAISTGDDGKQHISIHFANTDTQEHYVLVGLSDSDNGPITRTAIFKLTHSDGEEIDEDDDFVGDDEHLDAEYESDEPELADEYLASEPCTGAEFSEDVLATLAFEFRNYVESKDRIISDTLLELIESGTVYAHDTIEEEAGVFRQELHGSAFEDELAALVSGVNIASSDAAQNANGIDNLRAQGLPADYHEQMDRFLDDGDFKGAEAYAAQFAKPKGGHAAQQEARRAQSGEQERGR